MHNCMLSTICIVNCVGVSGQVLCFFGRPIKERVATSTNGYANHSQFFNNMNYILLYEFARKAKLRNTKCPIQLELRLTTINNVTGYVCMYVCIYIYTHHNYITVYFSERKQSKDGIWNYKGFIGFHVKKFTVRIVE